MNAELLKELDKILPVVVRVHGGNHPELAQVLELYTQLKQAPSPALVRQLREVTSDFTVPADACPTYRKTYEFLASVVSTL